MARNVEARFYCDLCTEHFPTRGDAERHILQDHDIVQDNITVEDPRNDAEPEVP